MLVRAVNTLHYGDEMDKDFALAICYSADNGGQLISMSFGKDLSPQKQWVMKPSNISTNLLSLDELEVAKSSSWYLHANFST